MPIGWKIGDRVTREQYMDDGTWAQRGDECLPGSPMKHGEVVAVQRADEAVPVYRVRWDGAYGEGSYFLHGLTAEGTD